MISLINFSLILMVLAFIPCIYRILVGPTIADRVIAVDSITTIIIVMLGVYSYVEQSAFYMDVALVLAIISFIGTVAVAKYIDQGTLF